MGPTMNMNLRTFRAVAAALLLPAVGCGITTPDLDAEGTVRFANVEGGCWGIESGGTVYEPINLPESMRIDGLAVVYEAERTTDLASVCQIGPIIRLLRITTAPD